MDEEVPESSVNLFQAVKIITDEKHEHSFTFPFKYDF